MQTFLEFFADPAAHPLHTQATNAGFKHEQSSTAAGVATHEYSHPKGHSLKLHTGSGGNHGFTMNTKRGKQLTGSTPMHFTGAMLQA